MFNKKPIKESIFANSKDENGLRYGSSGFSTNFTIKGLEKYKIHEGQNLIDVIPFNAGPKHPMVIAGKCEEGDTVYSLDYFVHKGIGPAKSDYTCLKQFGQRCPICDENQRYWAMGTEDAKKQATALRAKRRVVYLVHDLIDGKYYYWDTGWKSFEEPVNKRAAIKIDKNTGASINPFDWQIGKSISFHGEKDKYEGHDYIKISEGTFDFEDREPLSDAVLEHSMDLSEGIEVLSADDLDKVLCGKPVESSKPVQAAESKPAQNTASTVAEPDVPSAPSFETMESAPVTQETNECKCPCGHNWGDADKHPECGSCQAWENCIDASN